MIQRCAVVRNGLVENVIICDPRSAHLLADYAIIASDSANIGFSYADGVFTAPHERPRYQTSGLTFQQFMSLFAPSERAAIVGSDDCSVRLFLLMASGAGRLDLSSQELVEGLESLVDAGLLAPSRVSMIQSGAKPEP
jgi:hypothetical protein